MDLSVSPQTVAMPWWGRLMVAKNGVFGLRSVRNRGAGLPLLVLNTQCPPVWVR